MKILLITYDLGGTASGNVTKRISEELLSQGVDLRIICSSNKSSLSKPIVRCCNLLTKPGSKLRSVQNRIYALLLGYAGDYNIIWRFRAFFVGLWLVLKWRPNVIYVRSSPFDSFNVGIWLKRLFRIPIIGHFSDPLPTPKEYVPSGKRRNAQLKDAIWYLNNLNLVSMATLEAINYIENETAVPCSNKAFVCPDSVPSPVLLNMEKQKNNTIKLVYLGDIYGSRNPLPLVGALEKLNNEGLKYSFDIYSNNKHNGIASEYVCYKGRVNNVAAALATADILVDIDGDDEIPVFISSKLKEYLVVNRPILSISPKNSPARRLCENQPTFIGVCNSIDEIYNALNQLRRMSFCQYDYELRNNIIKSHTVEHISKELIWQIQDKLCYAI